MARTAALSVLALVGLAQGYSVTFTPPVKVASSAGAPLWKPKDGVEFGTKRAAVLVSQEPEGCSCDGAGELPKCRHGCGAGPRVFTTVDGGVTFAEYKGDDVFCGAASVATPAAPLPEDAVVDENTTLPEDDQGHRLCVDTTRAQYGDSEVVFPMIEWSFDDAGALTPKKLLVDDRKVTVHTQLIKRETPKGLRFGDTVLNCPDKDVMFRLAEVTYEGDDTVHGVALKSHDKGFTWIHAGDLPAGGIGETNSLVRVQQNHLRVLLTKDGKVYRTISKTLGRKWTDIQDATDFESIPASKSTFFTSVIAGGRMGPLTMTVGSKKGSEQYFNIVDSHNKAEGVEDADKYSEELVVKMPTLPRANCTSFLEGHEEECQSSGQVDVLLLGNGVTEDGETDRNYTNVLLCYDRLGNGFAGPEEGKEDAIWCTVATLNETAEVKAQEEKLAKKRKAEKEREEAYEKAKKMREEAEARKREKKREKSRKAREARKTWAKIDAEQNIAPARVFQEVDNELIIIRDLSKFAEYAEFIADEVGVPDKDVPPADDAEEQSQDAE